MLLVMVTHGCIGGSDFHCPSNEPFDLPALEDVHGNHGAIPCANLARLLGHLQRQILRTDLEII